MEGLLHTKTTSFTQVTKVQSIETNSRPSTQKSKSQTKYVIPRKSEQIEQEAQANLQKQINVPKFVGKYKLHEIVGRGAHGRVYKGFDTETGQCVAMKLMGLNRFNVDMKQSITYEIDLLKKLDHCNIVKYIDTVQSGQYLCIVLEFIEGGSLENLLSRLGCFSETLAAVYIKQVLKGLDYLHRQGVIHRDIKGGNILVTLDGVVKLADFGVATKLSDAVKNISFAGTPYWMAPEVIEMSGHVTSVCDIWSVGCTVHELLTGKPPYYNMNQFPAMIKIVKEQMPLPDDISPELKDFLSKCFTKDPKNRPDAKTMLQHEWFVKQSDQNKLAQILAQNPPLEVSNTIKIHLNEKGQRVIEDQKKIKKVIQDGKLVQVKRSASSSKNPVPLAQNAIQKTKNIQRANVNPKKLNESMKQKETLTKYDESSLELLQVDQKQLKDSKIQQPILIKQSHLQLANTTQRQANDAIGVSKTPTQLKIVTKTHHQTSNELSITPVSQSIQIKKIANNQNKNVPMPQNLSNSANTDQSQPQKIISYAKIQQACKNAALKFKKINLVQSSDKTPIQIKSRNPHQELNNTGFTTDVQAIQNSILNAHQQHQANLQQSKSFKDVHQSDQFSADEQIFNSFQQDKNILLNVAKSLQKIQTTGTLYDLRNQNTKKPQQVNKVSLKNAKSNQEFEPFTQSQLATEHSAYKLVADAQFSGWQNIVSSADGSIDKHNDSETQSKKQSSRSKARMIGRGFSMLAASCLTQNQQHEGDDLMMGQNEAQPAQFGPDMLSRVSQEAVQQKKQKENTRQNSGMTKQLASLISYNQHSGFEQTQSNLIQRQQQNAAHLSNQSYLTHANSHQSNQSYISNRIQNVPVLPKGVTLDHGHSSTFENSLHGNSIIQGVISGQPQTSSTVNLSNDFTAPVNELQLQRQREIENDTSRKNTQKIAASFLNQFQAKELSQRQNVQQQMFNKPPLQTLETPSASQSFELISNPQSRRNTREERVYNQQRLNCQNINTNEEISSQQNDGFQAFNLGQSEQRVIQRTASYCGKFAAAGPASSQQAGFQNGNQGSRAAVSGRSVDFYRIPVQDPIQNQNAQSQQDQKSQLIQKRPTHEIIKTNLSNQKVKLFQYFFDQASNISVKINKTAQKLKKKFQNDKSCEENKEIVQGIKQIIKLIEDISIAFQNLILKQPGQMKKQEELEYQTAMVLNKYKSHILSTVGTVTLIQLLSHIKDGVAYAALQLLNQLSERDLEKQRLLVTSGLIPHLIRLCLIDSEKFDVTQRQMRVEIAYFIGQVFQDSKHLLLDFYLACGGYKIQLAFLELEYATNTDLIMIAIDSFLVIFDECLQQKQQVTDQRKRSKSRESKEKESKQLRLQIDPCCIASLLIAEGLITRLIFLLPQLIRYADSSTELKDQSNAETILERIFDVLCNLSSFCSYQDKKEFCTQAMQNNLCKAIFDSIKEPQQLTFLITKQFMKFFQQFTSATIQTKEQNIQVFEKCQIKVYQAQTEIDSYQQGKLIKKLGRLQFVQVQVEILQFYVSLIDHIQLSSIYDSLKLLNLFCKLSIERCQFAVEGSGIVISLKRLMNYIDQQHEQISLSKRLRLLNLILSLIYELVAAGELTRVQLADNEIFEDLLKILKSTTKYSSVTSGYNQIAGAAPDSVSNASIWKNEIQNGFAQHLHTQSIQNQQKIPGNELALKVMDIFVLWIQKEDDTAQIIQSYLAQKSSFETIFNVFISPVNRNSVELLTFLISLHKMLLSSDLLVDQLLQQELLISHLQSQMMLLCNQINSQISGIIALNTISFDNNTTSQAIAVAKSSGSAKSANFQVFSGLNDQRDYSQRQLSSAHGFYDNKNLKPNFYREGATPTNIMLTSLKSDPMFIQSKNSSKQSQKLRPQQSLSFTDQYFNTQQAAQLLKELLEIFSLLILAKKAQYPSMHSEFSARFDIKNTVNCILKTAERKNLVILQEISRNVLQDILPVEQESKYQQATGNSPSPLSGTFNQFQDGQLKSDIYQINNDFHPMEPEQSGFDLNDDPPECDDDSKIETSDEEHLNETQITPSSASHSPVAQFHQVAPKEFIQKGFSLLNIKKTRF